MYYPSLIKLFYINIAKKKLAFAFFYSHYTSKAFDEKKQKGTILSVL